MTRADQSTDVTSPTTGASPGAPAGDALATDARERAVGALLRIPALRRLWTAQLVGGVADRLALLALVVLGVEVALQEQSFGGEYRGVAFTVALVFAARLVGALLVGVALLGPLCTLTAPGGPLDRRWTMVGCDALRVVLLICAPLWITWSASSAMVWLLVTAFLLGLAERVWTVARESVAPALLPGTSSGVLGARKAIARAGLATDDGATVRLGVQADRADGAPDAATPAPVATDPAAVQAGPDAKPGAKPARKPGVTVHPPAEHLAALHRLDLRTGYAALPAAAALLIGITLLSNLLAVGVDWFHVHQVALAADAAAGLFAGSLMTLTLLELPEASGPRPRSPLAGFRLPREHLRGPARAGRTGAAPLLVLSTAATCTAVAVAVSLAALHAFDLGGGPIAYGLLVLALSGGAVVGARTSQALLPGFSRARLFALAISVTGLALLVAALVPDLTTVLLLALLAGYALGVVAGTGHRLLDLEAEESGAGRLIEHLHTVVRVGTGLAVVAGPLVAGAIGPHRVEKDAFTFDHGGASFTLMLVGALLLPVAALVVGRVDDRRGTPLRQDLADAFRGGAEPKPGPAATGYFVAVEGGDGAGKSTQVELLAEWIRNKGHEVVVTREPGATAVGKRLRTILLDVSTGVSHRTEALLYAADRAEHIESVVRPALARGAVVISDRYVDSSVAYQGAGRDLSPVEVARISRWATDGLVPHLTVLLDVDPQTARERFTEAPDRLESESPEFHQRVRQGFLTLAAADPSRYLVVDAAQEPEQVATVVRHRLDRELPLSEQEIEARAEAERRAAEEARRRAEEEARRRAEEERLERERQEQLARLRAEAEERRRAEEAEARRQEEERKAEEARRLAEEARLRAEEEARRREAEEQARREEAERARRQAEEEERLRQEAEARRLEKQRLAEEALLRAEQARRQAEEEARRRAEEARLEAERLEAERREAERQEAERRAAERLEAERRQAEEQARRDREADATETVQTPVPAPPTGSEDDTRTVETPQVAPPATPADDAPARPVRPRRPASRPDDETTALPQVGDASRRPSEPQEPRRSADDETAVLPQVPHPPADPQDSGADPADRVPTWLWRPEPGETERTRELPQPQVDPEDGAPRRRSRRPYWAEETPMDDLPTLADELLGPRQDDSGYGDEPWTDQPGDSEPDQGRRGWGRRGR